MNDSAKVLAPGIVHMPGRKYPAVAVQGDSLSILLSHVEEATEALTKRDFPTMRCELVMLDEALRSWLVAYERTLKQHGFDLPYVRSEKKA